MYLIDTNIIVWVLRGNKLYEDMLQEYKNKAPLSISTITIAEIYKNIFPVELIKTEGVIRELHIWDVTASIAKHGGLYWEFYSKKLKKLHILDCLIAATAREYDLKLLTINTRHFPMNDITVFDPLRK